MTKVRLNLRNVVAGAICLAGITTFSGCNKENGNTRNTNFHKLEDRIGLWINADRKDTLEFVNSSKLIRKGNPYTYEEYLYRIEDNTLIISLPDSEIETYHSILKVEKSTVVLGNMYITIGFNDNSGTFVKK